ncbi:probable polygalacturonase At3g15720 [Tripterygium wilfordii]|uniref:probable polygalacturonase At3g15720 n=1 Tax=Tripterygium wilfordii TaxID=458696 RepID=UPI0018F83DA1|nr:probable polygalacturonase At3g15720 [Tripterygium wilfordii]
MPYIYGVKKENKCQSKPSSAKEVNIESIFSSLNAMDNLAFILFLGLVSVFGKANAHTFNVLDFGATPGTIEDNSQAFLRAWNALCNLTTENHILTVPFGKAFLLNPVVFNGPCNAKKLTFQILGEIVAPSSPTTWNGLDAGKWLTFRDVNGLTITGSGGFDGRGKGCELQTLSFLSSNDITLSNVHFINSPQAHILLFGSSGIGIDNIFINSPGDSPNTDGIHIQSAHNISITNSIIAAGDDCVSIGDYTSNIAISDVKCGPGHGISIGSLGRDGNEVQVENIHVKNVSFFNTTNGARIKTWQVGRGHVRDISFENCKFDSVEYPIIIDQNYCSPRDACKEMVHKIHLFPSI